MGFFSGLDSEGYDRQYSDRQLVGSHADYFRPYGAILLLITLLLLLIAVGRRAIAGGGLRGVDALSGQVEQPDDLALLAGASLPCRRA